MAGALLEKYQTLVASQELKPDKQQLVCVQQLNHLCDQLSEYHTHVQRFQDVSLQYVVSCAGETTAVHKLSHSMPELKIVTVLCIQAKASNVRGQLKAQEAEALARRKQQEGQQSGIWGNLMKRMQLQQTLPEETALVTARDREQKVQEILGPPPDPPIAPRGDCKDISACFAALYIPDLLSFCSTCVLQM